MILDPEITREDIIRGYDAGVKNIEAEAKKNSRRVYGGMVRSFKGKMLEKIANRSVQPYKR